MLPSNPRSANLPNNPRTRSAVRPSRRDADRYQTPAFDSQKPQQSAPPLPTTRQIARHSPATHRNYSESRSYHKTRDSGSSTASSNSSYAGARGYASSRTSLEDNESIYPKDAYSRDLRDDAPSQGDAMEGSGSVLWNGFVNVASSLTVNVSKAWASNVNTQDGEETPAGQESRLTRAMKAYHLEKARDPSELPAWLFNERERGVKGSTRGRTGNDDIRADTPEMPETPPMTQSSGFRAIYASAASTEVQRSRRYEPTGYGNDGITPSKAANRLRAMREPKHGRMKPTDEVAVVMDKPLVRDGNKATGGNVDTSNRVPRVGLPSGPMRRK